MVKFQISIEGTAVGVIVDGAHAAYRWIDDNASDGESYVIYGWDSEGKRVAVVEGTK